MSTTIHINPQFSTLQPFINQLADNGVPDDATLIYKGRNCVYTVPRGGYVLNIKAFKVPRFPNSYVYGNIRKSKAQRSMLNAQRLLDMGFDTPAPVAYIEVRRGLRMCQTYYVSLQIEAENVRDWLTKPDHNMMLPALAAEMVRLHRAGVFHKDFSPGNVLYTVNNGDYHFYLIDLNRMQFGVQSQRKLLRNFRAIYIESADETAHLARLYADAAGLNLDQTERIARANLNDYHKNKKFLRKIKSIFK